MIQSLNLKLVWNSVITPKDMCSVQSRNIQPKKIKQKKLRPAGGTTAPGHLLRRRPSHAGQEKPRTPTPPLHRGAVAYTITRVRAGRIWKEQWNG